MKNSKKMPTITVYSENPHKGQKKDNTDPLAGVTGWKRVVGKLLNRFMAWGDKKFPLSTKD